jgi:hypothetical protein
MHLWRDSRRPRFLSALLAIAALAALAMAVGFAKTNAAVQAGYGTSGPTTVKISQNAQFISSFQINVVVTLTCGAGSPYSVNVNVQEPEGFGVTVFGSGFTSGQCTGKQQKLSVPVYAFFDGWQLGNAVATATACTDTCGSDTKQIHIVA